MRLVSGIIKGKRINYEIANELSRTEKAIERKHSKITEYEKNKILSSNNKANKNEKLNITDKSMIAICLQSS